MLMSLFSQTDQDQVEMREVTTGGQKDGPSHTGKRGNRDGKTGTQTDTGQAML